MMYEVFSENFIEILYSIISDRRELVNFISDALHLDKRAVYRRLQGDYQFRINEVMELCSLLDISIDRMILKNNSRYYPPSFVYYPFDHLTQKDYDSIFRWLDKYKVAAKEKGSYVLLSANILPEIFCFQFEYLVRFYKLKWGYYMDDLSSKDYMEAERVLDPVHWRAIREYIATVFQFEKLLIVWDYNIIPSILRDIEYFMHIGYLTQGHKQLLKEELFLLIDKIDMLCKNCESPGSSTHFTFAVSSVYLKKTHSIFKGSDFKISVDSAFYTTYLYVRDPRIVESVEHIILSTLKSSVIISQSNEIERMKFITEQKELVEKM